MENFAQLNLPEGIIQSLNKMGITTPTPIQAQTIPLALQGFDVLASAQTGSGKTYAYSIPLILNLLKNPTHTALVLVPTRELAMQVKEAIAKVSENNLPTRLALLIGGSSMYTQLQDLKTNPRLIIGTPGRVFDHLKRKSLRLNKSHFLVVDEADRMLDMGFSIQLDMIAQYLPAERQTLMFSATLPPNMGALSVKYLKDPKRVTVESTQQTAPKIKQEIIHTSEGNKFKELLNALNTREGSVIVFVKTKRGAEQLAGRLEKENQSVGAIHGDLRQSKRERVIHSFRNNKKRIMVATDIAARGLDIPHVMHVINYDLPQCPEDYIHRIGRTGRAGMEGFALCLVSPEDGRKWKAIHRLLNPGAPSDKPRRFRDSQSDAFSSDRPRRRFGSGGNGGGSSSGGSGGRFKSKSPFGESKSKNPSFKRFRKDKDKSPSKDSVGGKSKFAGFFKKTFSKLKSAGTN